MQTRTVLKPKLEVQEKKPLKRLKDQIETGETILPVLLIQ